MRITPEDIFAALSAQQNGGGFFAPYVGHGTVQRTLDDVVIDGHVDLVRLADDLNLKLRMKGAENG